MRICFDIETNGLLDQWLDYSSYPFKFKEGFKIHCLCAQDIDTGEKFEFYGSTIKEIPVFFQNVTHIIAHNGIGFDLRVLQVALGVDFEVGPDTLLGHPCKIDDTLVLSRLLNPDRRGGHSLKAWGKRTGSLKGDYSESTDWQTFDKDMLEYCHQDVEVNIATWKALHKEWGVWDWERAYELEKATQYITSIQEHFGFYFDSNLAERNVTELNQWLGEIESEVEPKLPSKKMGKTNAKGFIPPKTQFLKNGEPSHYIKRFVEKHNGVWTGDKEFTAYGKTFKLPLPLEPILDTEPMLLSNQQDLKKWLVSVGWNPRVWSETDLTLKSQSKVKLNSADFRKKVERYVEETLGSPYEKYRCERLKCKPYELRKKLLNHDLTRPCKAYTSPKYTINQDKDIDPSLIKLGDQYGFIKDVIKWLTYRHRKNSILSENGTGFLTTARYDHRIGTPANTCGAATGRYQHKNVCNIPRVTSLYGEPMRKLFGCTPENYQLGYDAAGLEARIEGHYTRQFRGGEEYSKALVADKPYDIHTVHAKKNGVSRDDQKTLKYSISYGAQPPKVASQMGWSLSKAKRIFNAFWESAEPLKILKERVTKYWQTKGQKKFVIGLDGRKLWARSQHSILNLVFQSAGAIVCKQTNKIHWDMLKDRGMLFNPFVDSSIKGKAGLMIVYHDEFQWEMSPELVESWEFTSKDAAEEKVKLLLTEGKTCSNIDSHGDTHKVYYSVVGDLARQAMKKAGRDYNLRVNLDADYSIGKNWADCH